MDKYFYRLEIEQELWQEIQTRLPDRVFDCHVHLNLPRVDHADGKRDVNVAFWKEAMSKLAGQKRLSGAMIMPQIVATAQVNDLNRFVRSEVDKHHGLCVAHLIQPQDDPDETEQLIHDNPVITTLKPYFRYSPDQWSSTFDQFFPEWMADLANRNRMSVTLHIAREREALSDPKNYKLIQKYCEKYPDMRLILAHNALGHNVENLRKGLPHILGYPNIWFDSSGVSEAASHSYILEYFGPKRLIYGSDLPLGSVLGKIHSSGNGLMCIFENRIDYTIHFATEEYITTTYEFNTECMISLLTATDQWGLSRNDLADIFYNNAAWIYRLREDGIGPESNRDGYELTRYTRHLNPDNRPEPISALFSATYDRHNTPFFDFASDYARDCPLGFREHNSTAAARWSFSSGLSEGTNHVVYAQRMLSRHNWADGVAVTATPADAAQLALEAAYVVTGKKHAINFTPDNTLSNDRVSTNALPYGDRAALDQALTSKPAAILLPAEGFFHIDEGFLDYTMHAARASGVLVIYDEHVSGFRRPPGVRSVRIPDPDAIIYGRSAANGQDFGIVVASAAFWSALKNMTWQLPNQSAVSAALAVLDVPNETYHRLEQAGKRLISSWQNASKQFGLPIDVGNDPCFPFFTFLHENSLEMRKIYIREMACQGVTADLFAYIKTTDYYIFNIEDAVNRAFEAVALIK